MPLMSLLQPAGVDLFCVGKKFLVFNMVARNLKIKYRRSVLGVFWTLLNPLAMAAVYWFVFKIILKIDVPNYAIFVLSGILPWTFFSQSLLENMESLVANWGLISKVPIPLQVFPFVGVTTNLVNLFLSLPIVIGGTLLSGIPLGFGTLSIFYYFVILFLITYGFSLILSVAFVYFRDLRHIMNIIMQIWFYSTPVIYDESMVPAKFQWLTYVNPLSGVISEFHSILARGASMDLTRALVAGGWAFVITIAAMLVRKYLCRELVERI